MKRVAVIGAGLAGMAAAVRLADAGFRVTVLERGPAPGGRIRCIRPAPDLDPVDWGQHLMLGCYHEAMDFADRLGSRGRLRAVEGTTPFLSGPERLHPYRLGKLPAPLHALPGLFGLTQLSWGERLALVRPVLAAKVDARLFSGGLDRQTADAWLRRHGQSRAAMRGFWDPLIVSTLNLAPEQASAQLLATVLDRGFFARRSDAVAWLPRTTLHDAFIGPAVHAVEQRGGQLRCRQRAVGLELDGGERLRAVRLRSGERVPCDAAIVAVPAWSLAGLVAEQSSLKPLAERARRLSHAPIVSVDLWFDKPWLDYPYACLLDSPIHWLFNHHQQSAAAGEGFRATAVISDAATLIDSEGGSLADLCLKEIRRFFPAASGASLLRHLAVKVPRATICARPGQANLRPGARTELAGVFLAGDWTATGLPATIEGAVASGRRAADETLGKCA